MAGRWCSSFRPGSRGEFPQQRFDDFRAAARKAGLDPYCVFMGWDPAADYARQSPRGFDAVSAYAAVTETLPTFAELCRDAESRYWHAAARARAPCVPLVTTGWDKQPRKDNPVSWEKGHGYHRQTVFTAAATPDEIAAHLRRALAFVRQEPETCPASAVIIYAWNEHDEGGWLTPTWSPSGKANTARVDAVRSVLRPE